MEQYVSAVIVFILVLATYVAFDRFVAAKKSRQALRARIGADGIVRQEDEPLFAYDHDPSARAQTLATIMEKMGINVQEALRPLEKKFAQAGIVSPDTPIYFLFMQRVGVMGFIALGGIFFLSASGFFDYVLSVMLIGLGVYGPKLYLENAIQKRKQVLTRAFPDTLDLLLICTESGLALDASMNKVCAELGRAYPEMTAELNRTRLELALLNDRVRALTNLAERTDLVAFRALTASLIQSERFGTSLTDTLRVLSEDFRLTRLSHAENKAAKIPVYMTVPLIFLLMPAFLIIVLGPAIIGFMRSGNPMLGG
jgi:tight adherence protein C